MAWSEQCWIGQQDTTPAAVTLFPSTHVFHFPYRIDVLIGNIYKLLQCAKFYALLHTSKREVEKMDSISGLSDSKYQTVAEMLFHMFFPQLNLKVFF